MPWIAGVDGCKGGWIAVLLDTDTGEVDCRVAVRFADLVSLAPTPETIAVDMPIGLKSDQEPRERDEAARKKLKGRASSVFAAPKRQHLAQPFLTSYQAVRDEASTLGGLNRQSWGLLAKIKELDDLLTGPDRPKATIRECHPEVCFWAMNGEDPMGHSKKTIAGHLQRRDHLARELGGALTSLEAEVRALKRLAGVSVAADDFYDACATLWTARRIQRGEAVALPRDPPRDSKGLPMEIVY